MSALEIVKWPDLRLLSRAVEVRVFDAELQDLARGMLDLMYSLGACGLAAPQVGVGLRLIVFNFGVRSVGVNTERVMINPRWTAVGERKATMGEMCVSCPGVVTPVARFKTVKAEWDGFDPIREYGAKPSETLRGWSARVLQHEVDHLDGKVIAQPS